MPSIILDTADVLDFARVSQKTWKYKRTALTPSVAILTFSFRDLPTGSTINQVNLHYFVEKNYRANYFIKCYALVGVIVGLAKIPGDNWSFYETHPKDIYTFGYGPNSLLIDTYSTNDPIGERIVILPAQVINYITNYGTLTLFFVAELEGGPTPDIASRIASPLSVRSNLRPFVEVAYTGSDTPPDLAIYRSDINFNPFTPIPGDLVLITATVHNNGSTVANSVDVEFWDGSPFPIDNPQGTLIGSGIIASIPGSGGTGSTEISYAFPQEGRHEIYVVVGRGYTGSELHNTNSIARRTLWIRTNFTNYSENFEGGREAGEWVQYDENLLRNLPIEPDFSPHPPQIASFAGMYNTDEGRNPPGRCLRFFFNGTHDAGDLWIARAIPLTIPKLYQKIITLTLWAKHVKGTQTTSGNSVTGFIDQYLPETRGDFTDLGNIDEPIQGDWNVYNLQKTISGPFSGEIYVACGIAITNEDFEIVELIDDINIDIV